MSVQGFWGLQVYPGNQYTQKVTIPFMITMASLTDNINTNTRCSLIIKVDGEEYVVCSLIPEKIEQQVLGLTIVEGEEVTFSVKGDNAIHLTGNHVFEENDEYSDNQDELNEDIIDLPSESPALNEHDATHRQIPSLSTQLRKRMASTTMSRLPKRQRRDTVIEDEKYELLLSSLSQQQQLIRDLVGRLGHENCGIQQSRKEDTPSPSTLPVRGSSKPEPLKPTTPAKQDNSKTQNREQQLLKDLKNKTVLESKKKLDEKKRLDEKKKLDEKKRLDLKKKLDEKKKVDNREKVEQNGQRTASSSTSTASERKKPLNDKPTGSKIKRLPNGLVVEDRKLGQGTAAKSGDKVGLTYVGKLVNGKKFDSHTDRSSPYSFTLGSGKVIRGWDIGLAGMRVGGERKLTIPPALAYRQRGMPPDIPPNAILVFDIKLVSIA